MYAVTSDDKPPTSVGKKTPRCAACSSIGAVSLVGDDGVQLLHDSLMVVPAWAPSSCITLSPTYYQPLT